MSECVTERALEAISFISLVFRQHSQPPKRQIDIYLCLSRIGYYLYELEILQTKNKGASYADI